MSALSVIFSFYNSGDFGSHRLQWLVVSRAQLTLWGDQTASDDFAIGGVQLKTDKLTATALRRNGGGAGTHEWIENDAAGRTGSPDHALDNFQGFLGWVIRTFRMFAMQARNTPHIFRVVAYFQPFGADENRARSGFLCLRVVRNPDRVEVEEMAFLLRKKTNGVVYRRITARAAAH